MDVVFPSGRDIDRPVIPFSNGSMAYADGYPAEFNIYAAGTVEHARFAAGWQASASVADAEAEDIAREMAEDAAAGQTTGPSGGARA